MQPEESIVNGLFKNWLILQFQIIPLGEDGKIWYTLSKDAFLKGNDALEMTDAIPEQDIPQEDLSLIMEEEPETVTRRIRIRPEVNNVQVIWLFCISNNLIVINNFKQI